MSEILWPKKEMKAFAQVEGAENFYKPFLFLGPNSANAEVFKAGADRLIEVRLSKTYREDRDVMLLPIVYLYRHAIEVRLKEIIRLGIARKFFEKSEVENLWTQVRRLLDDCFAKEDPAPTDAVGEIIMEIHEADPFDQAFRYDRDRDGKPHRHETLPDAMGVEHLRDVTNAVWNYLTSSIDIISEESQHGDV